MKKILVLTVMLMLVASMSVMAADDVTITGEVHYDWLSDMDTQYAYDSDAELVITAVVDEFNTAVVDFDYAQDSPASTSNIQLDKAYFTTAIGKFAGLEDMGVTITTVWGWQEWANAEYAKITGYEEEAVWDAKAENWQVNIDVGIMDMVHIEAAFMPADDVDNELMFGAYGGVDPIHVEVYYSQEGAKELGEGIVGVGANFGMDVMPGMFAFELGLAFGYNMLSDAPDYEQYALGVGLATTIMEMAYLNVGFAGNDQTIFSLLWFELGAAYEDMVGADLGVGMTMDDDFFSEVMDELDVSVWVAVGKAKFRVGYVMHAEQDLGVNYYEGLNAPADAAFDPTVSSGVVYFSGDLDF